MSLVNPIDNNYSPNNRLHLIQQEARVLRDFGKLGIYESSHEQPNFALSLGLTMISNSNVLP
jgi:hypothetical protein